MMLTFRTQNCNARYTEARALWGSMINESRALSSRILALSSGQRVSGRAAASAEHAVKYVMTFSHTLKYHVTVDGFCPDLHVTMTMTDAELNAAKGAALREELASIWDYAVPEEKAVVDRLLAEGVASRPLHILHELSEVTAQVLARPHAEGGVGLEAIHVAEIYRSITRLQDVLGACERIYRTPIYTGYTQFSGCMAVV
jgi:predicted membrane chloride channel (bestrophin family)